MKKLTVFLLLVSNHYITEAQQSHPDQNPNWKKGFEKYDGLRDSLTSIQGTTEQKTYKAYDWTEAKNEKKQQRREFRQQRALARINRPSIWGRNQMNFYDPYWYPGRNRFWIY